MSTNREITKDDSPSGHPHPTIRLVKLIHYRTVRIHVPGQRGRQVQECTVVSRRKAMEPREERVHPVLFEINGRDPERSVGAWLASQLKRRGWGRWRAAEVLRVRLPKFNAWMNGSADPTEPERERITSVFGPGLP